MACCTVPSHWDDRFLALATEAASWSKDPRKKVGAIIASPDCRHLSIGYNGLPHGFEERVGDTVMDRETKNRYSLHAEENAIANAAQDVRGWTLYVTAAPCLRCAMAIHRAGISRLVTPPIQDDSQWAADQREAEGFLAQMGVLQERTC